MLFKCSVCEYTSNRQPNVERHIQNKHIASQNVFTCKFCCQKFKNESICVRHEKERCKKKDINNNTLNTFEEAAPSFKIDILAIIEKCRFDVIDVVKEYSANVKYDNIYITNLKSSTCHVFRKEDGWVVEEQKSVIVSVIEQLVDEWYTDLTMLDKANFNPKVNKILRSWEKDYQRLKTVGSNLNIQVGRFLKLKIYNQTKRSLNNHSKFVVPQISPLPLLRKDTLLKSSVINPPLDKCFDYKYV
jgi:hypothetical protein